MNVHDPYCKIEKKHLLRAQVKSCDFLFYIFICETSYTEDYELAALETLPISWTRMMMRINRDYSIEIFCSYFTLLCFLSLYIHINFSKNINSDEFISTLLDMRCHTEQGFTIFPRPDFSRHEELCETIVKNNTVTII